MSNLRAAIQKRVGYPIPDPLWELVREMHPHLPERVRVADIAADIEGIRDALAPKPRPLPGAEVRDSLPGGASNAAALARIRALSRLYAVQAARDRDVVRFREDALTGPGEIPKWVAQGRQGPYPEYRLLHASQVGQWAKDRLNEEIGVGEASDFEHAHAIFLSEGSKGLAHLQYIAEGRLHQQTVGAHGVLGTLAQLAETLASKYRWHPAEASNFVLTGRTPEVQVYTGSAEIRYHERSTTTRVTMTIDPALSPEQVMGIYSRLRSRLHDGGAPRSLSVKSYALAEQIGPYLDVYIIRPAEITGPGRRPLAGTHGYASRIHPLPGHTWRTLRSEWNTWCRTEGHPSYWLYREARNFTRDAQNALVKTLYLQWRPPQ